MASPASRHLAPVGAFAELFATEAARLPGHDRPAVDELRRARFARFAATGWPTPRVEQWKYTNIARAANQPMALARRPFVGLDDVSRYFAGGPLARRLIFVNGQIVPELSHARSLPDGMRVDSLETRLAEDPETVLSEIADDGEPHSLADLNAAFAHSGAWIELAAGVRLEEPLQLLFLTVGETDPVMSHARVVVRLGDGASLHLIETHAGVRPGPFLATLVGRYMLGQGAMLARDRLQMAGEGASFVGLDRLRLADAAELKQTTATLGGALTRNETELHLAGRRIEAQLNGVYMPTGAEHVDNLIRVHHEQPDCHSDQFYKGVLDGRAHAAFAGKIIVHQDAQRTNAYQKNANLILSDDAEINSKPELEIYADDVKCSHGSTCGELDAAVLFYLQSRGLNRPEAENLLTYAFAGEVVERFTDETVRRLAKERIFTRMPGGDTLEGLL